MDLGDCAVEPVLRKFGHVPGIIMYGHVLKLPTGILQDDLTFLSDRIAP